MIDFSDWTWLLRWPVREGECVPMRLWFFFHLYTLKSIPSTSDPTNNRAAAA